MYEENPYAAPESVSGSVPSGYPTDRFYVDGKHIMCGTPVALPAICVITGETEDIVLIRKTVTWVPKWIYVMFLAGVAGILILLIVSLLLRKQCKTSYYLSRRLRNRKRWMIFGGVVGFFGGFALIIAGADSQVPEILVPLGIISLIGSVVLLVFGQPPIKAVRHENGVKFWLKGFKQPFFDQLRTMYANGG